MTTFDQREEGFEKKFAHDEELKFRAEARRNRLLGLWAAEQLGLGGPAADAYAREVIDAALAVPGGRGVVAKVATDLAGRGVSITDAAIQQKMTELLQVATAQIQAGK